MDVQDSIPGTPFPIFDALHSVFKVVLCVSAGPCVCQCCWLCLWLPVGPRSVPVHDSVAILPLKQWEDDADATCTPWVTMWLMHGVGSVGSRFNSFSYPREIQTCIAKELQPVDK